MRASNFARIALCPGSYRREQMADIGIPISDETPEAESGTAIHNALAGLEHRPLSVDEETVYEYCRDTIATYNQELGEPDALRIEEEFKISSLDLKTKGLELTGHPDRVEVYLERKLAVIYDYKSGWGDVPPSEVNLQTRIYAVMLKIQYGKAIDRIDIVILQPRKRRTPDVTSYFSQNERGGNDFLAALAEVRGIAQRALEADPDKDLHPSEAACTYCSCRDTCPAVQNHIEAIGQLAIAPRHWKEYPVEQRLALWDKIKLAKKAIHLIELRFYEDLIEDSEAYGGELYLKKGRSVTTITDPAGVFAASGLTPEAFTACCKVGITALKTAIAKDRGIKGKTLDSTFQEIVGPHSEKSEARQSVEARH